MKAHDPRLATNHHSLLTHHQHDGRGTGRWWARRSEGSRGMWRRTSGSTKRIEEFSGCSPAKCLIGNSFSRMTPNHIQPSDDSSSPAEHKDFARTAHRNCGKVRFSKRQFTAQSGFPISQSQNDNAQSGGHIFQSQRVNSQSGSLIRKSGSLKQQLIKQQQQYHRRLVERPRREQ